MLVAKNKKRHLRIFVGRLMSGKLVTGTKSVAVIYGVVGGRKSVFILKASGHKYLQWYLHIGKVTAACHLIPTSVATRAGRGNSGV